MMIFHILKFRYLKHISTLLFPSRMMQSFIKKITFALIFVALLWALGYIYIRFFLPLTLPETPSSIVFVDNKGEEIGEKIYAERVRNRPLQYDEIPEFYIHSLIALEDRTFWSNNGVSLFGIARSMVRNIQAGSIVEWATTLSSGLIRNMFWIQESRTIDRKLLEYIYAIRLNHILSKKEILTRYINRVEFWYLNHWLLSASKYYFNREVKELTKAEQIALLSLPKDPRNYDPYKKPKNFRLRFENVVHILYSAKILSEEEMKDILKENLSWNINHDNPLPYVTDFLVQKYEPSEKGKNGEIQTTFDRALTEEIDKLAKYTLTDLAWRNVSDYGILIAERGESSPSKLRVMIGWSSYRSKDAGQVNTTLALRQPGSTIKPFTYTLAFERLGLTPESTILDLPVAYKTQEDYSYEPKNYSQEYKWQVSLRQALSESINVPAIKLTKQLWIETLLGFLRQVGITSLKESADHYWLSLGLGSGEVSLFELLQSYSIFSQKGMFCPFEIWENNTTSKENKCTKKMDQKYIDMTVSILTDRYAKLWWFPLYSSLDFSDRNVFVKTGTSRNFRDNWAIGFTDHYMIGVWTGNKSWENMKGVSGATGAGEIFRKIVYAIEKSEQIPVAQKKIEETKEYLVISNPLSGSIYRMEKKEKDREQIGLRFDTNISYDEKFWMLDGQKIWNSFIAPEKGNHHLEIILMKDGEVIKKEVSIFDVE